MSVRIYDAEKPDGTALWPEFRPIEWLMDKKSKMPRPMYNSQYRNDPSGLKGVRYDADWLNYYTQVTLPPLVEMSAVQAGDPATSESLSANYFGHATLARHASTGVIYVLDITFGHIPAPKHLEFLKAQYDMWADKGLHIYKVLLVEVGPQQATTQHLIANTRLDPTGYMPIDTLTPKGSKEQRYDTLLPFMGNGTILFKGTMGGNGIVDMSEERGFKEFKQEFMGFPKYGRDDVLDALWMCVQELTSGVEAASAVQGSRVVKVESETEKKERRAREYDIQRLIPVETPRDRVLSNSGRIGLFHR